MLTHAQPAHGVVIGMSYSTATRCEPITPRGLGFSEEDRDTDLRRIGYAFKSPIR